MRLLLLVIIIGVSVLYQSCAYSVAHRPFVATPYQPVLLYKKNDFHASFTLRPMLKYGGIDLSYAISDHFAIRASGVGSYVFSNMSMSLIYFNRLKKLKYFFAPVYSYQNNQIGRSLGNMSGTQWKSYKYDCSFHSPGIVTGISIKNGSKKTHHFNLKTQYNLVQKYSYDFRSYDRYTYFVNEQLEYKLPNFISIEPSYSLLIPTNDINGSYYKLQIGLCFLETTLKHRYHYNRIAPYTGGISLDQPISTSSHPKTFPVNISVSYIFN